MKYKFFVFAVLIMEMAILQQVFAYDFYKNSPSGHRLYYTIITDNSLNNNTLRIETLPSGVNPTGNLVIPDSVVYGGTKYPVTEICNNAFQNKTGLTSVLIPSTVNRIGSNVFVGCNNLKKVSFDNPHLSYVGEDAFYVSNYNSAYVGHFIDTVSITGTLHDWCNTTYFYNQSSNPLYHCGCLIIEGEKVDCLYVPEGVNMLKWGCLTGAPVEKIILPNTLKYIGSMCFSECNLLEEIIIPDSVTFIGSSCFSNCRNLRKVSFGVSVDSLNAGLFLNCISLDTIIFKGELPSYIAISETQHLFWIKTGSGISLNDSINPTIIVPCGQLTTFQNSLPLTTVYSCNEYGSYHTIHGTLSDIQEIIPFKAKAISNDTVLGVVEIQNAPSCNNTSLIIKAIPSHRCKLYRWSDGDTNVQRVISMAKDTSLVATFALFDTIYIHDTTIVTDTVTLTEYVPVHDTTYIDVPVHDTTYIDVPYAVHDTTIVTDTVTLTEYVPVHDTTYIDVPVHDTTYIDVPYAVHDTTIITDTVTLTEYVPVHDTTYIDVHDTTYIDVPYAVHDTTIITDTVTLTQFDTITNTVYDTIDHFVYDTMLLTDTIWLRDTIYIHDTVYITQEGVDGAEALNAKVYSSQGQIVIEGADGNDVTLFDITGRRIQAIRQSDNQTIIRFDVPASGTYMIKIGSYSARKVVVIR